ncbi:MAG: hypothetical protein ABMA64_43545 [Myxococcota bacterium]
MRSFFLSPCLLTACTTRVAFDDIQIDAGGDEVELPGGEADPSDPADAQGPLELYSSGLSCVSTHEVEYRVVTSGVATEVWLFQQETANNPPNWSENHTLELVATGDETVYERALFDGSGIDYDPLVQQQDRSTLFDCQTLLTAPGILSFAVALVVEGEVADCIAYGGDPEAMIGASLDRYTEPVFDLSTCRIVSE